MGRGQPNHYWSGRGSSWRGRGGDGGGGRGSGSGDDPRGNDRRSKKQQEREAYRAPQVAKMETLRQQLDAAEAQAAKKLAQSRLQINHHPFMNRSGAESSRATSLSAGHWLRAG